MTDKARKIANTILALLVSAAAWVFVVYNYYPMTDIHYSDVPVKYAGADALAERGLVVSESTAENIGVTINQKRIDSNRYKSSDIEVVADVSRCLAGVNHVSLSVSGPKNTTVISTDTESIEVEVERARSKTMDIEVMYAEGAPDNAEPVTFDLSQMTAEVISSSKQLDQVAEVVALLDYNEMEDEVKSYTCNLYALDKNGEIMPHVVIRPSEISLDACGSYTKTVILTVPVKGGEDDDYERTYTIPEQVTIKGPQEAIDKIGTVRAYEIDISYRDEDEDIPIEYNLPEGVYVAKESRGQVLKLKVKKKEQVTTTQSSDN